MSKLLKSAKLLVRSVLPFGMVDLYRKVKYKCNLPVEDITFGGNYASWQDAVNDSIGYDDPRILGKVFTAATAVQSGQAYFERDSVLFNKMEYVWPLLACLLRTACRNGGKLSVLDFGGSLGSLYYQHREFLAVVNELRWSVVEQKHFVDCGKKNFETGELRFYYRLSSCLSDNNVNVVLISNVLQYIEKPYELLDSVFSTGIKTIIIDRLPFLLADRPDCLTVQHVPPSIYPASYPAWFFNRKNFMAHIEQRYCVVSEFSGLEQVYGESKYVGLLLEKL